MFSVTMSKPCWTVLEFPRMSKWSARNFNNCKMNNRQ
jgi:hypothetical protein